MATPTILPATFTAGQVLTAAQMNNLRGAFRVLQVVQSVQSATQTITNTVYTDVTGMSVAITPSATSSKVLVVVDAKLSTSVAAAFLTMQVVRGSTAIYVGDAAGTRIQATYGTVGSSVDIMHAGVAYFLDSPATTSATTYKIQVRSSSGSVYLNRTGTDTDSTSYFRTSSSITVMEISA